MKQYVRNDRRLRQAGKYLILRKAIKHTALYIPYDLHDKVSLSSGKHKTSFNFEVLRLIEIALNIESKG